uniref:Small auxin up regulated protein n=1 Tax=Boehmeria nivea TaxID=83906 RepID=A0A172J246_BOENI|nr:small auxin up regulated protein [Boehmeria nivea]
MISAKRLLAMARKWQKLVAKKQRRISLPRSGEDLPSPPVAKQGHFVVYTVDKKRFEFPLKYLRSNIFVQLFRMSELEFGLPTHGPITLPCEGLFLEHVVSIVKEGQV